MNYWLLKSEPDEFGFHHLVQKPDQRVVWDGVRNYQARNLLRELKVGDQVFFYHSSCKEPAVIGICTVTRTQLPDPSQFDAKSKYFDEKSNIQNPRWITVEVEAHKALKRPVTLKEMRQDPTLQNMALLNRARLSVQPVSKTEWDHIMALSEYDAKFA